MVYGLGSTVNNAGRLLFYKSLDLENWEYVNFCEREKLGWMWECPDYFTVNGRGVVIFSPMGILSDDEGYSAVTVCSFAEFSEKSCEMKLAENYTFFDYGIDLYAPQSTTDENGNRVIVAWARMPETVDGKWNGMMCIPRVVNVENEHIYFRPHPNIRSQFTKKISCPNDTDECYMIKATLKNGDMLNIGGYIIKRENDRIFTDRTAVFTDSNISKTAETPVINDGFDLEIYVDKNLIEIYVNDGEYVVSQVVYNLSNDITGENYSVYSVW